MSVLCPRFWRQHTRDVGLWNANDLFRMDEPRVPAPRGDEELPVVDVRAVSEAGELQFPTGRTEDALSHVEVPGMQGNPRQCNYYLEAKAAQVPFGGAAPRVP